MTIIKLHSLGPSLKSEERSTEDLRGGREREGWGREGDRDGGEREMARGMGTERG